MDSSLSTMNEQSYRLMVYMGSVHGVRPDYIVLTNGVCVHTSDSVVYIGKVGNPHTKTRNKRDTVSKISIRRSGVEVTILQRAEWRDQNEF